jgi:hypothetical protein
VVGGGRVDSAAREVFLAVGQSPDVDLVADVGDALACVQVKTLNCLQKGRFVVTLATRGANQSWNGLVEDPPATLRLPVRPRRR